MKRETRGFDVCTSYTKVGQGEQEKKMNKTQIFLFGK